MSRLPRTLLTPALVPFEGAADTRPAASRCGRDPDVSHAAAPAAPDCFQGRLAEARRPVRLRLAGPQIVAERAGFRPFFERRSEHLNDHLWPAATSQ